MYISAYNRYAMLVNDHTFIHSYCCKEYDIYCAIYKNKQNKKNVTPD